MISVKNLTKKFFQPGQRLQNDELIILDDISLDIPDHCFCSIVGHSGSGKSTLMNILGLLDRPSSGSVCFDGMDISSLDEAGKSALRNRKIGFIFQFHHLLPELPAIDNVMLPQLIAGASRKVARDKAMSLLELVLTSDEISSGATCRNPANLSGGQRQRVAIARALVNEPALILADEPTGNLDESSTSTVFDKLREINQKMKATVVMVTHDMALAEKTDQILELRCGKLSSVPSRQQYRASLDRQKQIQRKIETMGCPRCGGPLGERTFGSVLADECGACHGIWLDDGELGMLLYQPGQLDERAIASRNKFAGRMIEKVNP